MTQDEKLKALIDAAKEARDKCYIGSSEYTKLDNALAAFAPEPEYEYPLPEWDSRTVDVREWCRFVGVVQSAWIDLRQLTRILRKPKGRK